jgi:myo-inositol-1(or 4)-monophosphatase
MNDNGMSARGWPEGETLSAIAAVTIESVRIGQEIARKHFRSIEPSEAVQKSGPAGQGSWNPVSEIDRQAETAITEHISTYFRNHAFLGEENMAGQNTAAEHLWIVDPIDGTSNYLHGLPHYAVSVGYAYRGTVLAAACLDVERDELFTAIRGEGAFLNGTKIRVSSPGTLANSLICTGFYYDRGAIMERTLGVIRNLFGYGIHGIRRSGSSVLDICWQASGRYDAYFELQLSPWDFLPAALVATEAGALVSSASGSPLTVTENSAICASPDIHGHLLEILNV